MTFPSLKYLHVLLLLFCLFCVSSAYGQITEVQAREMLAQKNIPEDTLRNRLLKKGYDPDKIRPEQVSSFQTVVLETIKEIEQDQAVRISSEKDVLSDPIPPVILSDKTNTQVTKETLPKVIADLKTPIYGQEIFRNQSLSVFQKVDEIIATDDYVLGTGDKIGVVGFGRSQFEDILTIGQDGLVKPSGNLPRILLKGLRLGEAKELLYQRYNQYHIIGRGQFQVTLVQPRNITVSVFGEAQNPGSYTLPGFNTAFNIISAAGGPTDIGSVRRIKVISGSHARQLDVYEFMNNPGVARNFFLQNNDYIHIPVAQKVVTIKGAVVRPMTYELLDNENLAELIEFAGGAKANSYLSDVKIIRFLEDRQVITNVNFRELQAGGGDYILYNGDIVEIKLIEDDVMNYVNVSGAVQFPGAYERRTDMRISDLVAQSVLRPEARLDFAYLLQYQPDGTFRYRRVNLQNIITNPNTADNILLSSRDELQVMTLRTYAEQSYFSVEGAVKRPDTFAFNPDDILKLEDAILLAGGLRMDAVDRGYIMRYNPREPKTIEYLQVDLREAFNNPGSEANVGILAGDRIVVFDKSMSRDQSFVSIHGEVRNPGEYPYGPGMTIADLVSLAGGLRFGADHERIDIARVETGRAGTRISQYTAQVPPDFSLRQPMDNSLPLMPFDKVYVRAIPEFALQRTVVVSGEVRYPGHYAILQDNERISDLISRAGGLTDEAFPQGAKMYRNGESIGLVVINLAEILQNPSVPSNVTLMEGDVIEIPMKKDLVTIGGFVNLDDEYSDGYLQGENSISVAFRGRRNAKYYVDNFAAGVSEDGAPSEIKVQYADGRVQKTKKFLFINQYPKVDRGSIVTVGPKKVDPVLEKENEKIDWGVVLKDTFTQVTAVLTILILVDQLGK